MLLIKYDRKTNVKHAINTWHIDTNGNLGRGFSGFYFIQDDKLKYNSRLLPNKQDVIYNSSDVAKWNASDIQSLPKEIFNEVIKRSPPRCTSGILSSCFVFAEQPEGYNFWNAINNNEFYKFYDNEIINNYETKLQDKNSSIIRGEEPKRNIICGKKSCASITSGSIEYGRISRGK